MLRFRIIAALTWCIPLPATACSLAACIDHGVETDRNFVVTIRHQGKPLQGVSIKVTAPDSTVRFSGVTTSKGLVEVGGLGPGDYSLDASFLARKGHSSEKDRSGMDSNLESMLGAVDLSTISTGTGRIRNRPRADGAPDRQAIGLRSGRY